MEYYSALHFKENPQRNKDRVMSLSLENLLTRPLIGEALSASEGSLQQTLASINAVGRQK